MACQLDEDEFDRVVEEALRLLPGPFASRLENVRIEVRRRPGRKKHRRGAFKGELLLGLYHGRPLTERSVEDSANLPDSITLYRENLEAVCDTQDELRDEIVKTLLHEIGHHFGLGEADLESVGFG